MSDPAWPVLPPGAMFEVTDQVAYLAVFGAGDAEPGCRVYWGSHGCGLRRGHEGDCDCGCCDCGEHHPYPEWPDEGVLCVARAPYYGPETRFYGEDAAARGLPTVEDWAHE